MQTEPNSGAWLVVIGMMLMMSAFYALPTFIAILRGHSKWLLIAAVNLCFGITGIGWILTLIWSLMPDKRD